MRTIRTKVYQFSELSEKAKQKAIESMYYVNVDGEWWEQVYEDAAEIGFKITGFDIDRGSYCEGEFTLGAHEVAINIHGQHGELCDTFKTADKFIDTVNEIQARYNELEGYDYENEMMDAEDEFLKSLQNDYLKMLRDEYEYLTSEDAIIETIEANGYEFTQDGRKF